MGEELLCFDSESGFEKLLRWHLSASPSTVAIENNVVQFVIDLHDSIWIDPRGSPVEA